MEAIHHTLDAIHRTLDAIHRTLDAIHRTLDAIHHTLDAIHRTLDAIHRTLDAIHRTLDAIQRTLDEIPRSVIWTSRALRSSGSSLGRTRGGIFPDRSMSRVYHRLNELSRISLAAGKLLFAVRANEPASHNRRYG